MRPIQTSKGFGAAIRQARTEKGWSQADLASKAGVSRPWLSELENGKRSVELGLVLSVLSALDLAVTFSDAPVPGRSTVDLAQLLEEITQEHG